VQNVIYAVQKATSWMVLMHVTVGKMEDGQVTSLCAFVSTAAICFFIHALGRISHNPRIL
jgi:hypothetical protein